MRGPIVLAAVALLVAGCNDKAGVATADGHGRYLGLGTFAAGQLWSQMKVAPPADPDAATIGDDENVIVVVDSRTGEVRQCGDYSGYCVRSNPWAKSDVPAAPVALAKHAADLAREAEAKAKPAE
ncbi:hypothetical protein [Glacieibacterium frigidum]|uniref:Lipoprotein n=1 Tax=Glacieibacterium frigidum TaxID=2593303 RepID=A0A552UFR1_9SPHN|nr:hypothetical protein [Glacieibacterium frigidum]TRW17060.1 hypothetical protein FMM06_02295 [Glacieibacterium frigidum]